jgi:hypothetical protein
MTEIKKSVTKEISGKRFRNFLWFSIFEKECIGACINFLKVPPTRNHASVTLPSRFGHVIKLEINERERYLTSRRDNRVCILIDTWAPTSLTFIESSTYMYIRGSEEKPFKCR